VTCRRDAPFGEIVKSSYPEAAVTKTILFPLGDQDGENPNAVCGTKWGFDPSDLMIHTPGFETPDE
jgi:hypothetical protein